MKYQNIFSPIDLGPVHVKNRIYFAPVQAGLSVGTYGGMNKRYIDYFAERARGGAGLIMTGHVKAERTIDPYPRSFGLVLDDRNQLKEYAELCDAVHAFGAKIAVELSAGAGRIADTIADGFIPAAPSEQPLLFFPKVNAREMSKDEIAGLAAAYGTAVRNAKRAGFDLVSVHATAYLIDQFLTPAWNKRTDEYGGSLENRMRFMMECIASAREKAGESYPLMATLTMDAGIEGGKSEEDCIAIAQALEAVGIVAIQLRDGSYDNMNKFMAPYTSPAPQCVEEAARIKAAVNIPVLVEGSLLDPDVCEQVLCDGSVDMVGLARPLLADPHWPRKARARRSQDIAACLRCNACLGCIAKERTIACAVNPLLAHEGEWYAHADGRGRKVLVCGAGFAGIQAAKTLADRGFDVVFAIPGNDIAGDMLSRCDEGLRPGVERLVQCLASCLDKLGVVVRANTQADMSLIRSEDPYAIVVSAQQACEDELFLEASQDCEWVFAIDNLAGPAGFVAANRQVRAVLAALG